MHRLHHTSENAADVVDGALDWLAERPLVRGAPAIAGLLAVFLTVHGGIEGASSQTGTPVPACASETFNPFNDFVCTTQQIGFTIGENLAHEIRG